MSITNNHYLGKGAVNALQLISILSGKKVKVPEPLREHYPALEKIADAPKLQANAISRITECRWRSMSTNSRMRGIYFLNSSSKAAARVWSVRGAGGDSLRVVRLCCGATATGAVSFSTVDATFIKSAIVARIFLRDAFRNRLRTFKLRAGIEMNALLAAVQIAAALRARGARHQIPP